MKKQVILAWFIGISLIVIIVVAAPYFENRLQDSVIKAYESDELIPMPVWIRDTKIFVIAAILFGLCHYTFKKVKK